MDPAGELERLKARLMLRRAEMDIEIDALDSLIVELRGGPADGCAHRNRREITGMGATVRRFYCPDCGAEFEEGEG